MNYIEFKNKVQGLPLIFSRDLVRGAKNKQIILNRLERWRSKKFLIQLKRGVYILNQNDRKVNPSLPYVSNLLYAPSYVSLEYALSYYSLIPEKVSDLTSISTKKTTRFTNELGTFTYQHIKPAAFRGFKAAKDSAGLTFFMAEPEKALVDFIYLNLEKFVPGDRKVFEESYRLQNTEILKARKIIEFAGFFNIKKLIRVTKALSAFLKDERA